MEKAIITTAGLAGVVLSSWLDLGVLVSAMSILVLLTGLYSVFRD